MYFLTLWNAHGSLGSTHGYLLFSFRVFFAVQGHSKANFVCITAFFFFYLSCSVISDCWVTWE